MASQSLYRKWRSQTFSDMVGQESIIRTLKNALLNGNPAHAYLFAGPRGTGKTSTARLLAKTINCLNPHDGEPCNVCEQCREITAGNSFNVIEIDAASNRGIDSIRELREKVMMPPSTGKYKVYILDEAHMLTTEAFNALLKTLEEPPPHAIFVMATTDIHKMLPTVLSRCQRFDFKRFTMQQLINHLTYVTKEEGVKLESGAAELIARAAAGGMRDALSLLDQAIAYAGDAVTLAQVQSMLGVADPRAIQKFILHVANLDSSGGLHLIHELVEAGADLRQVNIQIAEYWRAMMLAKAGANLAEIIDGTEDEVREILETSAFFGLEELTECARIFAQNDLVQKNQSTPQLGLELALLACVLQHQRAQNGSAQVRVTPPSAPVRVQKEQPSVAAPAPIAPVPPRPAAVAPPTPPQKQPEPPVESKPVVQPSPVEEPDELPDWEDMRYGDEEEEAPAASNVIAFQPPAPVQPASPLLVEEEPEEPRSNGSYDVEFDVAEVKERWELVKRRIKTRKGGARIAAVLNSYTIVTVESNGEMPVLVIKANADFHFKALQSRDDQTVIEWALKIEMKQDYGVRLLPPGGGLGIRPAGFSTPPASSNGSMSNRAAPSTQRSAYREQPQSTGDDTAIQQAPQQQQAVQAPTSVARPAPQTTRGGPSTPLARSQQVRENSKSDALTIPVPETRTTRLQAVQGKAKDDPIVQKVVEMFRAEIRDITLK